MSQVPAFDPATAVEELRAEIAVLHAGCPDTRLECEGKGRKRRAVPLTKNTQRMRNVWMAERAGEPSDPLFPTRTGRRLSRDAIGQRLQVHATTATEACPTLTGKRLHPHVLRHTCAVALLQAGVDTSVIALTNEAFDHVSLSGALVGVTIKKDWTNTVTRGYSWTVPANQGTGWVEAGHRAYDVRYTKYTVVSRCTVRTLKSGTITGNTPNIMFIHS